MHIRSLSGTWQFREASLEHGHSQGQGEWSPAQVPGCVHTDLLALGRIPDPFIADNELRVLWVAESDWEYRLVFQVPPASSTALAAGLVDEERVFLVCDGLDTLADVTLNGHLVGRAENMFRCYRWDVTSLLLEGENELRVTFSSPVSFIRTRQVEQPLVSRPNPSPAALTYARPPASLGGTGARSSRPSASGRTSAWRGTRWPAWTTSICASTTPMELSSSALA